MALAMARPWKHPKTGVYWLRKRVPDDLPEHGLGNAKRNKPSKRVTPPKQDGCTLRHWRRSSSAGPICARPFANWRIWTSIGLPSRLASGAWRPEARRASSGTRRLPITFGRTDSFRLAWTEAAISRLTDQTLHRSWCRQRAGEYVSAFGLTVDGDDLLKITKAIGVGAQKGRADVEAAGKRRVWPRRLD